MTRIESMQQSVSAPETYSHHTLGGGAGGAGSGFNEIGFFIQTALPQQIVSATSELAGYEAAQMHDGKPWTQWRPGLSIPNPVVITIDLGAAQYIDALYVENFRLSGVSVDLEIVPSDATTWNGYAEFLYGYYDYGVTDILSVADLSSYTLNKNAVFEFSKVFARTLKLTLHDVPVNSFIEYISVGLKWKPNCNFIWGSEYRYNSEQQKLRTTRGQLWVDDPYQYRTHNPTWENLDHASANELESMFETYGKSRELVFVPYPHWGEVEHETHLYRRTFRGLLQDYIGPTHLEKSRFSASVLFEEMVAVETKKYQGADLPEPPLPGVYTLVWEDGKIADLTEWLDKFKGAPEGSDIAIWVPPGSANSPTVVGSLTAPNTTPNSRYTSLTLYVDGEIQGDPGGNAITLAAGLEMTIINNRNDATGRAGAIYGGGGNGGGGGIGGAGNDVKGWGNEQYRNKSTSWVNWSGYQYRNIGPEGGCTHNVYWTGETWGRAIRYYHVECNKLYHTHPDITLPTPTQYLIYGGYKYVKGYYKQNNQWEVGRYTEQINHVNQEYFWDTKYTAWAYLSGAQYKANLKSITYVLKSGYIYKRGTQKIYYEPGEARYAISRSQLNYGVGGSGGAGGKGRGYGVSSTGGSAGGSSEFRSGAGGKGGDGGSWGEAGSVGEQGGVGHNYWEGGSDLQSQVSTQTNGTSAGKAISATPGAGLSYTSTGGVTKGVNDLA